MSRYTGAVRTNYFHVKDEAEFRKLMSTVKGDNDKVDIFTREDELGNTLFGFGSYGEISGIPVSQTEEYDDDELDYDAFIDELQKCVAEDDAIIIMEAGHEKLRYIVGDALVITAKEQKYISAKAVAAQTAAAMLGNPDWTTVTAY